MSSSFQNVALGSTKMFPSSDSNFIGIHFLAVYSKDNSAQILTNQTITINTRHSKKPDLKTLLKNKSYLFLFRNTSYHQT